MEERINSISKLINKSKEANDSQLGSRKIQIAGKIEKLDSHRFPIGELRFNIRNGRFSAELKEKEACLERRLDPANKKDEKIIRELLIEQEKEKTEALKKDLEEHGQTEPGIITADGYVINGNKRMAIFWDLKEATGSAKWDYMEFMVLPKGVHPKDLWRVEAGLQLADDKRISYGPINELLKIREGKEYGLTEAEIANSIYGLTKSAVNDRLEWLDLVEEYLKYVGMKGHYKEVEGKFEHIKSLHQSLKTLEKQGKKGHEKVEYIGMQFAAIQSGATNSEVRKIATAKRHNYKVALSKLRDAYRSKKMTESIVEDAVELVKSESEQKRPEKLMVKVVELLRLILDISHDKNAIGRVDKSLIEEAKGIIDKVSYKIGKIKHKSTKNIDNLKEKFDTQL